MSGQVLLLLMLAKPAICQVDSLNQGFQQIQNKEQALERAYRFTGFPTLDSLSRAEKAPDIVTSTVICDTLTPFLHDQIDGRAVWRTSVKQMPLASSLESRYDYRKDWEIFIDSTTGQFLMAVGKAPGSDTLLTRLPTIEEAEAQLAYASEEYASLPAEPPGVSLFDALETAHRPHTSVHQIFAWYTMNARRESPPKAVWIIYMRSTSVICGIGLPEEDRYVGMNMRTLIDAQTGELMYSMNRPFPLLKGGFGLDGDE